MVEYMLPPIEQNIPKLKRTNVLLWQQDNLGEGTTIVVLDEGFGAHKHMVDKVNVMTFGYDGEHEPLIGHGAGVMSIGNEIAPNAKIVYMPFNSVRSVQKWDMLEWIIDHSEEIDAITMSLTWSSLMARKYFDVIKWLGIPFTVSSGNDGDFDGVDSPADFDYTIAVGAASGGMNMKTRYSNGGAELTCIAPLILAPNGNNPAAARSGTSFTNPFVAFSLLLYSAWQRRKGFPKLTHEDALNLIKENAEDIAPRRLAEEEGYKEGFDYPTGWGLFRLPSVIPHTEPPIVEEPIEDDEGIITPPPIQPPEPSVYLLRVMLDWDDWSTQIGEFESLDEAIALANQHPGYKVYDATGWVVHRSTAVEGPIIDEPIIDEPIIEEPMPPVDEPIIDEPIIDEPISPVDELVEPINVESNFLYDIINKIINFIKNLFSSR